MLKSKEILNNKNKASKLPSSKDVKEKSMFEEKIEKASKAYHENNNSGESDEKKLENLTKYFENSGVSFLNKITSTRPQNVGYIEVKEVKKESFEVDVDLLNQVNTSGGIKGFNVDVNARAESGQRRRSHKSDHNK